MSKITLAARMADELGTSTAKAARFIDDIGRDEAAALVDDAASKSDELLPSGWAKPAAAVGGTGAAVGGGALVYREQDVRRAEALADQRQAYGEAMKNIIEADLPADLKRQLAQGAARTSAKNSDQFGPDAGNEDGGIIPDDPQTLIVLIIIMALVLKYALENENGGLV